jgi:hypothetical protein
MRRTVLAIVLFCLLALAPSPAFASGSAVIRDCTDDGQLSKHYSQKDLQSALANLPTDVDEYTNCRQVIRHAQLGGGSGGGTGGGGGGGSTGPATPGHGAPLEIPNGPQERGQVASAQKGGGGPIRIAGRTVNPGAARFTAADVRNTLPTPLIVALALLGLGGLAGGGVAARNLVLARRQG